MGVQANDSAASDGSVKYRLVEAEEVDGSVATKNTTAPAVRPTFKQKGKLNWAQFPMDDVASEKTSEESNEYRPRSTRGRGRGGRFGGSGRGGARTRGAPTDSNGSYFNGVWVPNQDPKLTAEWAKGQIEFYLSADNLVRDMFLRQHMDVDGYVPLAFVGSFQAVFAVHQDYPSLLDAVQASALLELDEVNEKVRPRHNWQQWLWPNGDGTFGVERYIKLQDADEAN